MNAGLRDILTSRLLKSLILLALIHFCQFYPLYHIHHSHDDDLLELELSIHPAEFDVEHETDHHHHDEELPHGGDHQDLFDSDFAWHRASIQTNKTPVSYGYHAAVWIQSIVDEDTNTQSIDYRKPPDIDEYNARYKKFRGPPVLG